MLWAGRGTGADEAEGTKGPEGGRFVLVLSLLVLVSSLPWLHGLISGAVSIPHNDDWAFSRILFGFVDTGDIELVGWNEMVLLGHLLWAYPLVRSFGEHIAVLNSAVALISAVGVVLSVLLARRFLPTAYALAVGALVAIFPGHLQTSVSYMTDPVGFCAQLGCILLGLAGIASADRRGRFLIAGSMLIGLYGFSIREFSLLAPVAVGVGAIAADVRRKQVPVTGIASLAVFVLAAAALYAFRQSLPDGNTHSFGAPGFQRVLVLTSQSLFAVGLALSPIMVLLASARREVLMRCLNAGALIGLALAVVALQNSGDITTCCLGGRGSVFVGNALTERGVLGNQVLMGDRPILFPYGYWLLLSALGIAGGSLGLGWIWSVAARWLDRGGDIDPARLMLLTWGVGTGAALVFRAALGGPLFDRYLTPVVLVAGIFALRSAPRPGRLKDHRGALAAAVFLGVTSLSLVTSGLSFDLARWEAGRVAVQEGVPASSIDAGFEWVGHHYEGVTNEELPPVTARMGPGYMDMFPAAGNCIVVASSPQHSADLTFVRMVPYRVWFGIRTLQLWVYRNQTACDLQGVG